MNRNDEINTALGDVIFRDSSWDNGNLWGDPRICPGEDEFYHDDYDDELYENPYPKGRHKSILPKGPAPVFSGSFSTIHLGKLKKASNIMKKLGMSISSNQKTGLCMSTPPKGASCPTEGVRSFCKPTARCREFCFGQGTRFKQESTQNLLARNATAFLKLSRASQATVDAVAEAILTVCMSRRLFNLRWGGVGDLNVGQVRVIDSMVRQHKDFQVWGFTRKGDLLLDQMDKHGLLLGKGDKILANVNFNMSIDDSMDEHWLALQAEVAGYFESGLAYFTPMGIGYRTFMQDWTKQGVQRQAIDPDKMCSPHKDPFLEILAARKMTPTVIFGLHNSAQQTHVSVKVSPAGLYHDLKAAYGQSREVYHKAVAKAATFQINECPATDPLGGGHIQNACQQCRWCFGPDFRKEHTLLAHRKQTIIKGKIKTWKTFSLLNGKWG